MTELDPVVLDFQYVHQRRLRFLYYPLSVAKTRHHTKKSLVIKSGEIGDC